ncbi:MAG: CfrBI family restriction endonuclease [Chitinophagaceae bacterium]
MTLTNQILKNIITRVIKSKDYRIEIVNLINIEFLQFAVDFFRKIVDAKLQSKNITIDWYKNAFLNPNLSAKEIAINSGLNKKTIHNMFNSSTREIVVNTSNEHYDLLYQSIQNLIESETELDLTLTIKFKGVSVELNVSESLIVINTLAVKRSALRGGAWATAGKSVEKYLMRTICELYKVPTENFDAATFVKDKGKKVDREIDFYLIENENKYLCEVKLMGKGNPESADAIIARNSDVFVADTLSQQNKNQCDELGIFWVALRDKEGFRRFKLALEKLHIPHQDYKGNIDIDLPKILNKLFKNT